MTFKLSGVRDPAASSQSDGVGSSDLFGLSWSSTTLLPGQARSAEDVGDSVDVDDDDVLSVHFDDGFELLISGDDYLREFLEPDAQASRRAARADVSDGPVVWNVPSRMSAASLPASTSRGLLGDIVKVVVQKVTGAATETAAELTAGALAKKYEDRTLIWSPDTSQRIGDETGMLLDARLDRFELKPADAPGKSDGTALLFVHGTASSTGGSFGGLWDSHQEQLARLEGRYSHVWAFQHRTLTHSPVKNAISLVKSLPEGAKLHVVSHSRGGLIGELLCRGQRVSLDDSNATIFGDCDRKLFDGRETTDEEHEDLAALEKALRKKKLKIERFVRVACPALGTTLASRRTDRWLSFALWALKKAANGAGPTFGQSVSLFAVFAKALVKQRTNADVLPGLEAMMPGSPLVRMLNREDVSVESDLSVIAGDREGDEWHEKALLWLPDLFYGGDHDIVVNTGSMYGGARRVSTQTDGDTHTTGKPVLSASNDSNAATYFLDRRAKVSHFHYFRNGRTVRALINRLLSKDAKSAEFKEITEELIVQPARSAVPGFSGSFTADELTRINKPIVILLPGIMGSELSANGDPVWVSLTRLMFGGLDRLKVDASDQSVEATGLLADPYQDICQFLSATHHVIAFPYDWRLSVDKSARNLKHRLDSVLDRAEAAGQPVRFLAHSMGGLVLAALIKKNPDVWTRVRQHVQARAVLLGTPLDGSWSIVQMLFGRDDLVGKLAMLDLHHDQKKLLDIIRRFRGVLELLPVGTETDSGRPGICFDRSQWDHWQHELYGADAKDTLPVPRDGDLQKAAATVASLRAIDWSAEPVLYVSGRAPETPAGLDITPAQGADQSGFKMEFSAQGDGRVPWDLSSLNGVPRWFMDAEHGNLASHKQAFAAVRDLLQNGSTSELSRQRPQKRSVGDRTATRSLPEQPLVPLFPTTRSLSFSGLGSRRSTSPRDSRQAQPPIKVSVVHSDLAFARYPLAVGHYRGDPFCGPEYALDDLFDGRLARRQALGLYAGKIGTSEICLSKDAEKRPGGAIIVGLGDAGALTASKLERTFARAIQEYALAVSEHPDSRFTDRANQRRTVRISSLLIGTGADSLSVKESLEAMLRGAVLAAEQLERMHAETPSGVEPVELVELVEIEIVEVYFDRAYKAAKCLTEMVDVNDRGVPGSLASSFDFCGKLTSRAGHQRRLTTHDAMRLVASHADHEGERRKGRGRRGHSAVRFADTPCPCGSSTAPH